MIDRKLVIFDWDGTLMDSVNKIVRCFIAAAKDLGWPVPEKKAIENIIGLGLNEAFSELYPSFNDHDNNALADCYRVHFIELDDTEMLMFDGVEAGLERLSTQGYELAIATGKARRGLIQVLDETGLEACFKYSRCADESGSKPHPQMLFDILAEAQIMPQQAVMIGDTTYDIEMAQRAAITALGVSYGVHNRDRLLTAGAVQCVDNFDSVIDWIEGYQWHRESA